MSTRVDVRKTYKLYIGGAFPRSESGRTYEAQTVGRRVIIALAGPTMNVLVPLFLFFALFLWPAWIPLGLLRIEKRARFRVFLVVVIVLVREMAVLYEALAAGRLESRPLYLLTSKGSFSAAEARKCVASSLVRLPWVVGVMPSRVGRNRTVSRALARPGAGPSPWQRPCNWRPRPRGPGRASHRHAPRPGRCSHDPRRPRCRWRPVGRDG